MIPNVIMGTGFKGVLRYVFDVNHQGKESAKKPQIIASNMSGRTPEDLTKEFEIVQSLNQRVKTPVFHCPISFPIGENPPKEILERIPNLFIEKMGKQAMADEIGLNSKDNQFVAIAHHDKGHLHLHLILNRVRKDGKLCYVKWKKSTAQQACREIEQELGLTEIRGDSERLFLTGKQIAWYEKQERRTGITPPKLEQYRREREQRLQEIENENHPGNTGSLSERDLVGGRGKGIEEDGDQHGKAGGQPGGSGDRTPPATPAAAATQHHHIQRSPRRRGFRGMAREFNNELEEISQQFDRQVDEIWAGFENDLSGLTEQGWRVGELGEGDRSLAGRIARTGFDSGSESEWQRNQHQSFESVEQCVERRDRKRNKDQDWEL